MPIVGCSGSTCAELTEIMALIRRRSGVVRRSAQRGGRRRGQRAKIEVEACGVSGGGVAGPAALARGPHLPGGLELLESRADLVRAPADFRSDRVDVDRCPRAGHDAEELIEPDAASGDLPALGAGEVRDGVPAFDRPFDRGLDPDIAAATICSTEVFASRASSARLMLPTMDSSALIPGVSQSSARESSPPPRCTRDQDSLRKSASAHARARRCSLVGLVVGETKRILVLPPDFDEGVALDYRLLGMQFWLADKFTEIGLEGARALVHSMGYGSRELGRARPFGDEQIHQMLSSHEARFGLLTSFRIARGRAHLATARLAQLRRDPPLAWLGRWQFDGDTDHLPTAVHDLFRLAAEKLGYVRANDLGARVRDQRHLDRRRLSPRTRLLLGVRPGDRRALERTGDRARAGSDRRQGGAGDQSLPAAGARDAIDRLRGGRRAPPRSPSSSRPPRRSARGVDDDVARTRDRRCSSRELARSAGAATEKAWRAGGPSCEHPAENHTRCR